MKLIDIESQELKEQIEHYLAVECTTDCKTTKCCVDEILKIIKSQAPIDVASVTRCKDCKYSTPFVSDKNSFSCNMFSTKYTVPCDGYCWFGEQKDDA